MCPHRCPFLAQSQRWYRGFRVWFGIRASGGAPDMAGEFLKLSLAGPIRPTRPIRPANKQTKGRNAEPTVPEFVGISVCASLFPCVIYNTWARFGRSFCESIKVLLIGRAGTREVLRILNFEMQQYSVSYRSTGYARAYPATCSTTFAACTAALQPVVQPLQPSPRQLAALQPATLQPCSQQLCSLHLCRLQVQKGSAALAEGL